MATARTARTVVATALAAGLTVTALAAPALAAGPAAPAAPAAAAKKDHAATQAALRAAVVDGVPGAVAQARVGGRSWTGTAGERGGDDRFRVGSITKTFAATVLLQLQAEGRLDLDDPVEKWLPGVVRGNGHDGRRITVRQLLNHTSGIYNVTADPVFQEKVFGPGFLEHRYDRWTPAQLVAVAMEHAPDFAPGTSWNYSNTNYVLAGMVIEKVTGRPYGKAVENRIIKPLKLRATSVPGTDPTMPNPSSPAYSTLSADGNAPVHDVSELSPTLAYAAGEMISDSRDLQTFYRALFQGRLLPKAALREMTTTVDLSEHRLGAGYGLGIMKQKLDCGKEVWGHGGGIHGSLSEAYTTRDGRHSLAANINADWTGDTQAIIEGEFCGTFPEK
ncbi:beta-lactamase family protein [Streptomyces sp. R302]|uniref:serine hydrolase domain-containing protein n=1 Tax=unclassified Streptomyces TaxID=2593676 RepID=UPI00145EDB74|nr:MULTISPECIES: serine hydrolase domain-containing protein [unclassified Streptomyces]NML49071.1 beta-lactamase family protein [Streptomyces sp. R301]NML77398.1 beta-lactamase family protein [Streptomyces sp. R302]